MGGNGSGVSGTAVAVSLTGALFAFAGVKGYSVSKTVRAFINGTLPTDSATAHPLVAASSSTSPGSGASGFTGSTPGASAPPGGGKNDFDLIKTNLLSWGFSKAGAAGALGNISVETGGTFSTTAYNQFEQAIGYCQWEKGRRIALQAYAAAHGWKETDSRAQLGYMRAELLSARANVYLYMRGTSDPRAAAGYWDTYFEVSDGSTHQERMDRAAQYFASM